MICRAAFATLLLAAPVAAGAQSAVPPPSGATRTMHFKMSTAVVRPVPIERPQGAIVLQGQIADSPATFLFDNGCDATLIDEGFARQHGMAVLPGAHGLSTGLSTLPTGSTEGAIAIGDAFSADGRFVTADLTALSRALGQPIAGVLGADALAAFVVVVNPARNWIAFGLPGHLKVTSRTNGVRPARIPFGPGYVVAATMNGQPVNLQIDYGSVRSAVQLADAAWQRVIPPEARTGGSTTSVRADGLRTGDQPIGVAKALKLSADLWISDVPVLRRGPSDRMRNDGLLGLGILGSGVTILDTARRQLWLYAASEDVSVAAEDNLAAPDQAR